MPGTGEFDICSTGNQTLTWEVFHARCHPRGSFSPHVSYRNSKIRQYFKLERALRTETTINDPRDFGIGKLLKKEGFEANRRLLEVEKSAATAILAPRRLTPFAGPRCQRASAPAFGNRRAMTLFAALCMFMWLPDGFRNAALREKVAELLGLSRQEYSQGAMTYDLRRLRLHGLISKIPHTHRYELTLFGSQVCQFMIRIHQRIMVNGLSQMLDENQPATAGSVAKATQYLDRTE